MSPGPLCGRIRLGDELRYRLARRAPSSLIQGVEIFPDGSASTGDGLPVNIVRPSGRALLVGIGGNQAGIVRKSGPLDQPFCHAAPDHGLEQLSQKIAIAEAAIHRQDLQRSRQRSSCSVRVLPALVMALNAPPRIQIRRLLSEMKAAQPLRSTRGASRLAGISPAKPSWHKNPIVTIALKSRMTTVDIACSPFSARRKSICRPEHQNVPRSSANRVRDCWH